MSLKKELTRAVLIQLFRDAVEEIAKKAQKEYAKRFPKRQRRIWQNAFYCFHLRYVFEKGRITEQ